jgi:hypothetical protein
MKAYVVDMELIVHAEDHDEAINKTIDFMPEATGTNEGVESWFPFRVSLCSDEGFSWHISDCRMVEDGKVLPKEIVQ